MTTSVSYWDAAYEFGSKFIRRIFGNPTADDGARGIASYLGDTRQNSFRRDINGLRGLSVVILLLFHLRISLFSGGFVGVDVFFVISGYLITRIILSRLAEGTFSLREFYLSRFARLMPALLVMGAVIMAIGWVIADPVLYRSMAIEAMSATVVMSNLLFFSESGYFSPAALESWFIHTWSLSVEWQFYFVYPVILSFLHRYLPKYLRGAVVAGCVASFGLEVLLQHIGGARMASFLFYMLPSRAWELLLGACVHLYPLRSLKGRRSLEAAGIVAIVTSAILFERWQGSALVLPTLGAALIIACERGDESLLRWPTLQQIGIRSYSIYLWHWPLIVGLWYFDRTQPIFLAIAFFGSFVLGWASYRWVERPWRQSSRQKQVVPAFVGAMVVLIGVSAFVRYDGGVISRAAPSERLLLADAASAKTDLSFPFDRCEGLDGQGRPRICTVGPSSAHRVLVLGDSYAQMWYPRYEAIASEHHLTIDVGAMAGCLPIDGIGKLSLPKCGEMNRAAAALAGNPVYDRVVLIGNWYGFLDYTKSPHDTCLEGPAGCDGIGDAAALDEAIARLQSFVASLVKAGKAVSIVLPPPALQISLPSRLARDAFWQRDLSVYNRTARAQATSDPASVQARLEKALAGSVTFIDLTSAFCDDTYCRFLGAGNFPLVVDNAHLRASFTRQSAAIDSAFISK